jgi:putative transposase
MVIEAEVLDKVIEGKTKEEILGEGGILKQLVKAIAERALQTELASYLSYEKHEAKGRNSGNSRNGCQNKTIRGEFGETLIEVPRERNGSFDPKFIPKGEKRFDSFDRKILSLYARGMTTRDIQAQLKDLYGVEVSPTLISDVTSAVMEEVIAWQNRALDKAYPIVYFDAIMVKIKQDKQILNKEIYLALGVSLEGNKELLGMWCSQNEGSKFWMNVLTELKNRGLQDILICCVDGLSGFPQAIKAIYPQAKIQLCIVHLIRQSLKYVSYKQRKEIAADLKEIYGAVSAEMAEIKLHEFSEKWDAFYPAISKIWYSHWENIVPFFAYPAEIRKVIYTTNAIESLNMTLRKVLKNKRIFPSDEAAFKQIYLALQNISKRWTMPIRDWKPALARFAIEFEGRVSL